MRLSSNIARYFVVFSLLLAGLLIPRPAAAQFVAASLTDAIQQRIEFDEGSNWGDRGNDRLLQLFEFYSVRHYAPVWVGDSAVNSKGRAMAAALVNCAIDGLIPRDYDAAGIQARLGVSDMKGLADLEIRLSKALISYGHDLSAGRVQPNKVDRELYIYPEGPGPVELLNGAALSEDVTAYLSDLTPQMVNYGRLKTKLAEYRAMQANGGWVPVPDGETLKPGMSDVRIPLLRTRLVQSRHLKADAASQSAPELAELYDDVLSAAVKQFQYQHGLTQDGVLGPNSMKAMNVPLADRIRTMELNMERRRWMEDDLGDRYIFVNLADFWLKVVDGRKTIHTAHVVVGKTYHRTPVFSKNMKYIVLNPYWNVPRSIAVNEYLPKLQNDPGVLGRQNISLMSQNGPVDPYGVDWMNVTKRNFAWRLRQDSGRRNALGRIKFLFPNKHNVYIHDTPSKSLFKRTVRSFSHGCVRVQNPVDLAAVLLKAEGRWSKKAIEAQIASGKRRTISLKTEIPVHITYLTAWVNKDGSVHFRNDIYGRDTRLAKALRNSHIVLQSADIEG